MQIGSSIRPILCRCLFNGQCPVMNPTKILNLDSGSLRKYLLKIGLFQPHSRLTTSSLQAPWGAVWLKYPLSLPPHDTRRCQRKCVGLLIPMDTTVSSRTLLHKAPTWRESLHCSTTLEDTAYDLRVRKVALLSEQIDTGLLTIPSGIYSIYFGLKDRS
jgi:hypothetical protein